MREYISTCSISPLDPTLKIHPINTPYDHTIINVSPLINTPLINQPLINAPPPPPPLINAPPPPHPSIHPLSMSMSPPLPHQVSTAAAGAASPARPRRRSTTTQKVGNKGEYRNNGINGINHPGCHLSIYLLPLYLSSTPGLYTYTPSINPPYQHS